MLACSGCGLRPVYFGGSSGPVATMLGQVGVDPIPGRDGWLVYNKLKERLAEGGNASPRYRLVVTLDDQIIGLGIRGDRATTRERRTLRARYQLVSLATGEVVLDATAGSDAGVDVVSSEYATVAAEQTAAERLSDVLSDQIVSRLALYASRGAAGQ
jgi:LPS-assembly lipoprotein